MTQIICQDSLSTQKALEIPDTKRATFSGYAVMSEDGRHVIIVIGAVPWPAPPPGYSVLHFTFEKSLSESVK